MNDVINITIEEISDNVNLTLEETIDNTQVNVEVIENTETVNITVNDVGIAGKNGEGLSSGEVQDILDRLNVLEDKSDGDYLGATPLEYYILAKIS